MSCTSPLQEAFKAAHPEITCLLDLSHPGVLPRMGMEFIERQAWYDREIDNVLDNLPDDAPSRRHYELAVYWLAHAGLQRLIESLYEGAITLAEFSWCKDQIRIWEEDHLSAVTDPSSWASPPVDLLAARTWAKAVVRRALAD